MCYKFENILSKEILLQVNMTTEMQQETLGSYTSTDMQNSGNSDKQAALGEMRAAKAQRDEQSGGEVNKNETLGKVEKSLGSVTGCEGMEEEGAKRQA